MGDDLDALNYDDLEAVAHLASSERYSSIMTAVRAGCCWLVAAIAWMGG